ncbi:heterokaryon incompatibility protein [Colletotrichum sojae]|uniref:Heterokaryon incompatibility protein n=1 Tax=Colletotrichum sojae TaxID=2175907 RepID=A0A8H6MIU9_9PEZI|nr:heterokaryon incompatibility protein [Colletotrichum sojae]
MLQDPKLHGVFLLVDALDECLTGLEQLLDLVTKTSQSTSAKWLISSRNWLLIEERLREVAQRLSLEVNSKSVSTAVDSYVTFKISQLSKLKGYRDNTASEIRQYLSSNAEGTFLWVALVCQELEKTHRRKALEKTKSFPPGLDALYNRMMQQIDGQEDAELCRQFLALVVTTYRPLSLAESTTLIEECHNLADDPESLRDIISLCGSFLTIRKDTIYFVHQSAKDFLLNKAYTAFDQILPSGIAYQHHIIFSRSLDVLSRTLRRDVYKLRAPGSFIEDISPPDPDPLGPVKYSCTYWIDHLQQANSADSPARGDLQDNACVHTFLKCHYLHWLEAQSLLQGMPRAVLAMQKLQTLVVSASLETQLAELVRDAFRFVLSYKQCIESFPLQLYIATLLFSPAHSLVRQLFQAEAPAWITMITKRDIDWSACQQTLEGHSGLVSSVAFSPDGRQLASGATGQCQQTLEGHSTLENIFEVAIQERTRDLTGQHHMLSQQDVWITNRSQNILWLPPEYRASSHAEDGSKIAVGCQSGRVLLLCFEPACQQS